jgi:hypothetical protein
LSIENFTVLGEGKCATKTHFQYIYPMKNNRAAVLGLCLILFACKKDVNQGKQYAGSYEGDIVVTTNGDYDHTISHHHLGIEPSSTKDQFILYNNVINLATATISGHTLTLPRTLIGSGSTMNMYEYGTGEFSGDTLRIEFHQDRETPANNTAYLSEVFTGTLIRK